jgi:hypothetical protein
MRRKKCHLKWPKIHWIENCCLKFDAENVIEHVQNLTEFMKWFRTITLKEDFFLDLIKKASAKTLNMSVPSTGTIIFVTMCIVQCWETKLFKNITKSTKKIWYSIVTSTRLKIRYRDIEKKYQIRKRKIILAV